MQKYHVGCGCRMMALRSHALCGDMAMVGVRCCFASGCSCRWWQWQLLEVSLMDELWAISRELWLESVTSIDKGKKNKFANNVLLTEVKWCVLKVRV